VNHSADNLVVLPQYPFEFAKTRAQLQTSKSGNPLAVIAQVAREDGVRSIYTGCSTLILVRIKVEPALLRRTADTA
jgi:hypothetical protein